MPRARDFRAAVVSGDTAAATEVGWKWAYAGYRMAVFPTSEEKWAEDNLCHAKLPFYMPDALKLAGADVVTNPTA